MLARFRIAVAAALIALAAVPSLAFGEDDAGPKPPFEGDPGGIGKLTVSGGGFKGELVTGTFAPDAATATWEWSWQNGTKVSGCGAGDTTCVIRVNPTSIAYKLVPATGTWELNTTTQSGWSTLGVTRKDPGEYPWFTRDWFKVLFGEPPACVGPGIATPTPRLISGGKDWSFLAEVSPSDGLVVRDVKLGERTMAAQMSLPYFTYAFGPLGSGRGELVAAGTQAVARSRLLSFDADQGVSGVTVTAVYGVDLLPGGGCLEATQSYAFDNPVPGDHCEPAGKLPCARFVPKVSYRFLRRPDGLGDAPFTLSFPQRLEFVDEAAAFNATALALDQDGPLDIAKAVGEGIPALSAPVIRRQVNPVLGETTATVIRGGAAATTDAWDNFHQTEFTEVQLPRAFAPEKVAQGRPFSEWLAVPGCPECIHMHWRWGTPTTLAPDFADANGGRPRIPEGSLQDVTIGIVRATPAPEPESETDPIDWRALANNELLGATGLVGRELPPAGRQARIAFWYEGSGHQDSDSFLTHGGFFAVDEPGKAVISQAALIPSAFKPAPPAKASAAKPAPKQAGAVLRFKLSEWGTVLAQIEQRRPGVKTKAGCVKPTRKRGKPCTRTIVLDQFAEDGGTDRTSVPFTGRIGKKALPPGDYRLSLRGRDLSGDLSTPRVVTFTIRGR